MQTICFLSLMFLAKMLNSRIVFVSVMVSIASLSKSIATNECVASDRKYNCNCLLEPRNKNASTAEEDKYNSSASHFIPAINSLHYCSGHFQCTANFIPSESSNVTDADSYMLCFSDHSCLLNGGFEFPALDGYRNVCIEHSCLFIRDLVEFNVTNDSGEVSVYFCIQINPEDITSQLCLKTSCKSFMAIEKPCVCNFESRKCRCSNYCQKELLTGSHTTYALFLSFGDIFTTMKSKGAYLHWVILIVLCVGLVLLLIIFCRLCKVAVDPSCGNDVPNPEILRQILASNIESASTSVSTTAKSSFSAVERCSPPPTYEQVLKDKCIEFKKSVT